jgi:hypothetical protein
MQCTLYSHLHPYTHHFIYASPRSCTSPDGSLECWLLAKPWHRLAFACALAGAALTVLTLIHIHSYTHALIHSYTHTLTHYTLYTPYTLPILQVLLAALMGCVLRHLQVKGFLTPPLHSPPLSSAVPYMPYATCTIHHTHHSHAPPAARYLQLCVVLRLGWTHVPVSMRLG